MYVDDAVLFTGMGTHQEEHPSPEDMHENSEPEANDTVSFAAENMRQSLQLRCDDSLQAGQQAKLSKYECLPTFWARNEESRLQITTPDDTPCTIHVADQHGIKHKIRRLKNSQPLKGLGFLMTMSGDMTPQFKLIVDKTRDLTAKLRRGSVLRATEAWLAPTTRILPAITFTLSLTTFTVKQCKRISVILEDVVHPQMEISWKMKKAVLYAPSDLGGLGLPSICLIQDQKNIQHLVRQLEWGSIVSNDIHITLSQLQLQSGFIDPILEFPTTKAPHLEAGWTTHIRGRLKELNASIVVKDVWDLELQRVNDASLMEVFCKLRVKTGTIGNRLRICSQ